MSEELKNCPVCNFDKFERYPRDGEMDSYFFQCERCGEFETSRIFLHDFSDIKRERGEVGYILSGLARELYEIGGKAPSFTIEKIEETLKHYLIPDVDSIEEKAEKLLQRIKEKTKHYGRGVPLYYDKDYPLAYAQNTTEFVALLEFLEDSGYITAIKGSGVYTARLSFKGWNLSQKIGGANKDSERGFVAIWFDDSMNESIEAIETAIQECNFKPICIRDEHFSEKIMDKALGEIRQSRFVVVDLTGNRGSVFFEAGFAFGLGVETIYVYKENSEKEKFPLEFYARHYQCYKYKTPTDLKEILKNAISARIKIEK